MTQKRPQPLAAVEHAVPHRRHQPLRTGDLAGLRCGWSSRRPQQLLHGVGAHFKGGFEGDRIGECHRSDRLRQTQARSSGQPAVQTLRIRQRAIMPNWYAIGAASDGADRRTRNRRAGNGGEAKGWTPRGVAGLWARRAAIVVGILVLLPAGADPPLPAVLRASGLDADAEGSRHVQRLRPALGVARRHRAGAGPFGDHVGGRAVLRPSRRRPRRTQGRHRRCAGRRSGARRLDHHHADGEEPLPLATAARHVCARWWSCRWRSISTWCCRSGGSWRSISTSPNGGPTSTASRLRRSIISACSAKELSRRQAALLAVTLPNPIARNPAKPGRA